MAKPRLPLKGKGKKKNQQLLLAGGGAAVVVVIAALMKRKSASAADSASGTTAATTGVQGTYDSTANDVYNSLEDQLGALQQQIAAIGSGGATTGSTGGTGGGSTSGGGTKKPKPKPVHGGKPPTTGKPIKLPGLSTVTVQHNQTLGGIAAAHHESLSQLFADNPVYKQNPKYRGGNRIWAGDKVKVR